MDQKFTVNCERLVRAIANYTSAGLTNDRIDYYCFAPKLARTITTTESATLPNTGLPIRGAFGTQTIWESHKTDKWLASERALVALQDEGDRTYIPPAVPYQSIVEEVKVAYAGLTNEIVSDCNLAKRLFESL